MSRPWQIGDIFVLRHAGFPFDWFESLGWSETLLAQIDAILAAEEQLIARAQQAGGRATEQVRTALRRGTEPRLKQAPSADWTEALASWRAARQLASASYRAELGQLRSRLHELASDQRVQDAVFLSNPSVYENVWSGYVDTEQRPDNAHWRRIERVVYTYMQRLCAKNETTSFFGPMGYGAVVADDTFEVEVRPTQQRRTFLTYWAVTELARMIGRSGELRAGLPLRRNPLFVIDGALARSPTLGREQPLDANGQRLLRAIDGGATSLRAAAEALGLAQRAMEQIAVPLLRAGVLLLGITIPTDAFDALSYLCTAVAALPPGPDQALWQERLGQMAELLVAFAASGGAERRALLATIEQAFSAYSGQEPRRGAGQVYADRLVIYEEASSPFAIRIGQRLAELLAARLADGLNLSASYGQTIQRDYRRQMLALLDGAQQLPFMSYARRARPQGEVGTQFSPLPTVTVEASAEHQQTLPADLCGPLDGGGRYALPDVCLIAGSPEQIRAADFGVLLSRVHHHLLIWNWLAIFYPDRTAFEQVARSWLLSEPSAAGIVGLDLSRRNKGFYSFPGDRVVMPGVTVDQPHGAVLSANDLTVSAGPDGPIVHDPHGQPIQLYLPLADYPTYPPFGALTHPLVLHVPLRGEGQHLPRLQVGAATYQRERWQLQLDALAMQQGLDLVIATERERRVHGWPRFVFTRVASERKPQCIDTHSPFGLELLRRLARDGRLLVIEEMLPAPDGLWLRDEHGRYTCELRMQAVRWSAPELMYTTGSGAG